MEYTMIRLCHDNILVTEIPRDSKAGVLVVSQDESSAYMFVKIEEISPEATEALSIDDPECLLVVQRTAKLPFIQNKFFISYKDVIAVIDREYFERI